MTRADTCRKSPRAFSGTIAIAVQRQACAGAPPAGRRVRARAARGTRRLLYAVLRTSNVPLEPVMSRKSIIGSRPIAPVQQPNLQRRQQTERTLRETSNVPSQSWKSSCREVVPFPLREPQAGRHHKESKRQEERSIAHAGLIALASSHANSTMQHKPDTAALGTVAITY